MKLTGKTVLLTGATDGIGRELALQLRAKGANLILVGRNPERVAAMSGQGFEVIEADLSGEAGVDTVLSALGDRPFDILINNAGTITSHDFRGKDPDLPDNDRCIFLNFIAPVHLIAKTMPKLRSRPEAMIVNVTSGLAIAPRAGGPIYCATKSALRVYTQALRAQLAATKIHVLEALPPSVETKLTATRKEKKMSPAECARQIVKAMEGNAEEVNIGSVKILKLVHSLSPGLARRIMIKS